MNDTQQPVADPSDSTQEQQESLEETQQTQQTETETQAPAGEQDSAQPMRYGHPALDGKSPQEIAALFQLVESNSRDLEARLSADKRSVNHNPPQPEPDPVAPQEFFNDPARAVRQEVTNVVQSEFRKMMTPFVADLQTRKAYEARAALRQEISDFAQYEPHVDQLLKSNDFPDPTDPNLLRSLYFMAKGMVASQPSPQPTPTREPVVPNQQRVVPPQHRPSSTPLPPNQQAPKTRQLTEIEARLAKEAGMSDAEYIAWQEADADLVISMDRPEGV